MDYLFYLWIFLGFMSFAFCILFGNQKHLEDMSTARLFSFGFGCIFLGLISCLMVAFILIEQKIRKIMRSEDG